MEHFGFINNGDTFQRSSSTAVSGVSAQETDESKVGKEISPFYVSLLSIIKVSLSIFKFAFQYRLKVFVLIPVVWVR